MYAYEAGDPVQAASGQRYRGGSTKTQQSVRERKFHTTRRSACALFDDEKMYPDGHDTAVARHQFCSQVGCRAHLPEKHPVEVGSEVDVVPQRKTSDVAPQVRIGLVRNLYRHHHHAMRDRASKIVECVKYGWGWPPMPVSYSDVMKRMRRQRMPFIHALKTGILTSQPEEHQSKKRECFAPVAGRWQRGPRRLPRRW